MTRSRHRTRVALKEPANVDVFRIYAHGVIEAVESSPWFPNPVPPLPVIKSALAELDRLSVEAVLGPKGSRERRDEARDRVVIHLLLLRAYVEWVAALDPENRGTIIASSRFEFAVKVDPVKPRFRVKAGPVSGSVVAESRAAAKRADYEYQYSADQGATWTVAEHAIKAKVTIGGLRPGTLYLFRVRATTVRGITDWTDPFAFMVT
jgi:hypothetical protein